MKATTFFAAAVIAVALLSGCGEDDEQSAARSQPLNDFQKQAEPICDEISEKIAATTLPSSFPADLEEYDAGSKKVLAIIEQPFTELSRLEPPEGREQAYARFSAALTAAVAEAKQLRRLVEARNDDTDALALPRTNIATHQAQAMNEAEALGLEGCETLTYKEVSH